MYHLAVFVAWNIFVAFVFAVVHILSVWPGPPYPGEDD